MEKEAEREWGQQKEWERQRQINREKAIQEIKCFKYGEFGHIVRNYRKKNDKVTTQQFSNKFEVLSSRMMNMGIPSEGEIKRNRKMILREEKVKERKQIKRKEKKEKPVEVRKIDEGEALKEITVKIGLIDTQKYCWIVG